MWQLDHKEGWVPRIDAFELWCWKTLESPLNNKEIKPVNLKEISPEYSLYAEAPIVWPPDPKSQFFGKDPDAGIDWSQEKGEKEDEMVGWHHWLNGHEFEQAPEDGEIQESLVCCSPWGHKESTRLSDWTTRIVTFGLVRVWRLLALNQAKKKVHKRDLLLF